MLLGLSGKVCIRVGKKGFTDGNKKPQRKIFAVIEFIVKSYLYKIS